MKEQLNERESAIMKSFAESSDKLSADYEKKIELLRQKQDAKIIELKREKSELVEYYNQQVSDLAESQQNLREMHAEEIAALKRQLEMQQQSFKEQSEILE